MKRTLWIFLSAAVLAAGCGPGAAGKGELRPMTTTVRSAAWTDLFRGGTVYATPHYRIYSTVTRPMLMSIAPGFLEAAHDRYTEITGLNGGGSQKPAPVFLLATRPQWAEVTRQLVQENQNIYLAIDAGGYCYRDTCVFWDVGGLETLRLASHEGLHQFFGRHDAHLPIWLEEGLCTSAEGFDVQQQNVAFRPERNFVRLGSLRTALIQHRWIPIEKLTAMDGGDAVQDTRPGAALEYYAQLWALALYLQSRPDTQAAVKRIIADCSGGRVPAVELTPQERQAASADPTHRLGAKLLARHVFLQYVNRNPESFDRDYQAFARKLAGL